MFCCGSLHTSTDVPRVRRGIVCLSALAGKHATTSDLRKGKCARHYLAYELWINVYWKCNKCHIFILYSNYLDLNFRVMDRLDQHDAELLILQTERRLCLWNLSREGYKNRHLTVWLKEIRLCEGSFKVCFPVFHSFLSTIFSRILFLHFLLFLVVNIKQWPRFTFFVFLVIIVALEVPGQFWLEG